MTSPLPKDIETFRGYDVDRFAGWLRVGLEGLLLDGLGVSKFEPLEYCINVEHTLTADLEIVYRAFAGYQQEMIRKAIAQLIDRLRTEQRYAPVFRLLLDLAAAVGAQEIFNVLPGRAEAILAITSENPELPSPYDRALEVIAEIGDHSTAAATCIDRLIGTPNGFNFDHAQLALIALCRISPADFAIHMARLRAPLMRNFEKYVPTEDSLKQLASDITKAVSLVVIQEQWDRLDLGDERPLPNDNWIHDPMLEIVELRRLGGDPGLLSLKGEPDICVTVVTNPLKIEEQTDPEEIEEFRKAKEILSNLSSDRVTEKERDAHDPMLAVIIGPASRNTSHVRVDFQ